jgi:Recombinase zinc beta ribbon domain/Recombinase
MLGLVAEYRRRATSERTADAKRRAIARGVPTFARIPPGYRRRKDGTLEPDRHADTVAEAFRLRADGATVMEVREHLRANGVDRSFHGTQALLKSRIVLGELRFGELVNDRAHEAIVDEVTWRRVQRQIVSRGRRPRSERLLARLGVLRCRTCGARMVAGTTHQGRERKVYEFYRCPPVGDCPRRVTISAQVAEEAVVAAVKNILSGITGTASTDTGIAAARADVDRVESELDAAVRAFTGLDDVDAARERLAELRDARDTARDRLFDLEATVAPAVNVGADDWDLLTLAEQRDLIRAVVDRATVTPGRGPDRVTIEPRAQ